MFGRSQELSFCFRANVSGTGVLVCVDYFLYQVTLLPLRAFIAVLKSLPRCLSRRAESFSRADDERVRFALVYKDPLQVRLSSLFLFSTLFF